MYRARLRWNATLPMRVLAVAALAVSLKPAGAQTLTGAGSTFINPIMTQWIAAYKRATGVSVNYQSIGSGRGINALISQAVDFGASDAPMNPQEMAEAKAPILHLPAVIGAVVVAYNTSGAGPGLHLTGSLLADIFLGKVTFWDDHRIAQLNPKMRLPHARILPVHRSDSSGTTYIFTDYLAKISAEWQSQVGFGKEVPWPEGLGGKGNQGVAGLLKTRPNSIGYIELAYAVKNQVPYAAVQNMRGGFILPSAESASAAAVGVTLPSDLRASLTNTPHPNGYPISGFSWLIVRQHTTQAAALKRFLLWVILDGQSFTKPLAYAALPPAVRNHEVQMINSVK